MDVEPLVLKSDAIRSAVKSDLKRLVEIDDQCFDFPWLKSDFSKFLGSPSTAHLLVVKLNNIIVGYMVVKIAGKRNSWELLRIGVSPEFQRRSLGRQMLQYLIRQLTVGPNLQIVSFCPGLCETAQLFLSACGFTSGTVHRDYFKHGTVDLNHTDDAYEFQYATGIYTHKPAKPRGPLTADIKNRIARYMQKIERHTEDDDDLNDEEDTEDYFV